MVTFQEFEQALQDTLPQLYHPAYPAPEALLERLGHGAQGGMEAIRPAILQAIANLEPAPNVPACARSRRTYEILSYRYVQKLTQEETAERLSITPRHLRREQRLAVTVLARRLWGDDGDEREPTPDDLAAEAAGAEDDSDAWRSQVKQELAALQKGASGSIASVGEVLRSVAALVRPLLSARGIALDLELPAAGLSAAIQPSQLSQILVTSVARLARSMPAGSIRLSAAPEGARVKITVTGDPVTDSLTGVADDYITDEMLAMLDGSLQVQTVGSGVSLCVDLPAAGRVRVLVVDDNADLVHFYRRYAQGTRYDIVDTAEGQGIFATIEAVLPAVIVLDVMLPDVDGWELLAQLHEHPLTRSIPVIICSVVREKELSLALGAALYVPKPVRRTEFLQALDRVLTPGGRGGVESPAST